ncbi:MAG: class I SAM-dependent methyltransferase [Chloroflexota bacterium]
MNWLYDEYRYAGIDYTDPEQVAVYDQRHQRFRDYQKATQAILARLELGAGHTVIDLGSGTGAFALHAAPHVKQIYAVDVSIPMLDYARQKTERAALSNVSFHHGGFLTYRHTAEPVDAIVSVAALHHLPDMWKGVALLRCYEMLKPGGRLYLYDVVFPFVRDYAAPLQGWVDDFVAKVGPEFALEVETHIRDEFSTYDWVMEGLLRRAGFHIESAEYNDGFGATYLCKK